LTVHQSELLLACQLGAGVEVVEVVSDFACVAAAAWATRMQRMESMTVNPVISVGHPVVSAVVSSELCGRQRQHPPRIWCTYLHCTLAIVSAAATRADITILCSFHLTIV